MTKIDFESIYVDVKELERLVQPADPIDIFGSPCRRISSSGSHLVYHLPYVNSVLDLKLGRYTFELLPMSRLVIDQ